MAICKDCIAAGVRAPAATTPPCDGLTLTLKDVNGKSEVVTAYFKDNAMSLLGYDILFDFGGKTYSLVLKGGTTWIITDPSGSIVIWQSADVGPNNNACPPRTGWVDASAGSFFSSVGVDYATAPGPSNACDNANGTFDTNLSGWTASNFTYNLSYGGSAICDTTLLGSLSQDILTVGETYDIKFDYSAAAIRDTCTPSQYSQGFIKVYAGTKVVSFPLDNTINDPSTFRTISTSLTCEGNTTFKIELQDPNQCYTSSNGNKGSYIDNVCVVKTTIVTNPTGDPTPVKSVPYRDMAEVPAQINGKDYNTVIQSYQECLAKKGTTYYNKVVGAVRCDDRELQKLKLIIGLLDQKDQDRALDCVYDRASIITAVYPEIPCEVVVPYLEGGTNTIILPGDYSQFESFTFEVTSPAGYAVATGLIPRDTSVAWFFIGLNSITFNPIGYYYSLYNDITYQAIDDNYPQDVFNPLPITGYIQDYQGIPGVPADLLISGTVISQAGSLSVANNTRWALYDPNAVTSGGETFSSPVIDAVYDAATDTTTILLQDAFPGDVVGSTICFKQNVDGTTTYLKTFTDFANRFCADCILTDPAPAIATTQSLAITTTPLKSETGITITTEFNQQITI